MNRQHMNGALPAKGSNLIDPVDGNHTSEICVIEPRPQLGQTLLPRTENANIFVWKRIQLHSKQRNHFIKLLIAALTFMHICT